LLIDKIILFGYALLVCPHAVLSYSRQLIGPFINEGRSTETPCLFCTARATSSFGISSFPCHISYVVTGDDTWLTPVVKYATGYLNFCDEYCWIDRGGLQGWPGLTLLTLSSGHRSSCFIKINRIKGINSYGESCIQLLGYRTILERTKCNKVCCTMSKIMHRQCSRSFRKISIGN
jgi:hypothetical protein